MCSMEDGCDLRSRDGKLGPERDRGSPEIFSFSSALSVPDYCTTRTKNFQATAGEQLKGIRLTRSNLLVGFYWLLLFKAVPR